MPSQQRADVEAALSGAVRNLIVSVEAYPDLKSNQNFLELQRQLTETEDRIAAGRRFYNANVRVYNTKIESVPTNLIANAFKFEKATYFEVNEPAVRSAPDVSFGEIAYRGDPQQPAQLPPQQPAVRLPTPCRIRRPTTSSQQYGSRPSSTARRSSRPQRPAAADGQPYAPPATGGGYSAPQTGQAGGAGTRPRRPGPTWPPQQTAVRVSRRPISGSRTVPEDMTYTPTRHLGSHRVAGRARLQQLRRPDGRRGRRAGGERRDRRRRHPLRHRRRLRQPRPLGDPARPGTRPPALRGRAGHQVRRRHGRGQRPGLGCSRVAALHPDRRRGQPAPARHRLDRPLPAAQPRPQHPDRGDPGRADASWSPRARCATSGHPTSPAGRSWTPTGRPVRPATRRSSRPRTSTPG